LECCETVGLKGKTVLVSHVETRWNSVYIMFLRALELKSALILYFVEHKIDESDALNTEDWKMVEDFTEILKHLYFVTKELSSEKNSTLSKVIPMINLLYLHYSPKTNDSPIGKVFRALIYDGLKHYFAEIENENIFCVSTIYDPRFKNMPTAFSAQGKAQQAVRLAKAEALDIAHENDDTSASMETEREQTISVPSTSKADADFWESFDSQTVKSSKRSKTADYFKECIDLEMRKYLSLDKVDRKSCPIKWWKDVGSKQFPQLFECAKKYQCMLATSVPSERVFSNAGQVLNKKRSNLGKNTANMLITLHTNLE